MNLDIHLDGSNTLMGTGYLEIHISKEVLKTLDIGKNQVIVIGITGHKTAGNTGNHALDRNTGSHQ